MKNFVIFITLLICAMLNTTALFAAGAGSTGLNFLKIEAGAKATGSGGAFSAVADDPSAVYWNPAGLAHLRHKQLSLMHLSWLEGINYQFLSYVHPTRRAGAFGVSAYYLSTGDIQSYDNYGAELDKKVNASDLAFALSYGIKAGAMDYGLTAKYIQENLADESANSYAFDAGIIYRLSTAYLRKKMNDNIGQEFRIALGAQNIGPGTRFIEKEDPLPLNYRIGAAQDFLYDRLTVSCDANFPNDGDMYINSGIDYRITDWISVRAGYKFKSSRPDQDIQPGFMGGMGVGNEYVSVDYAFVPYSTLGNTHRIGLSYRFGSAHREDMIDVSIQKQLKTAKSYYQKKDLVNAYHHFNNVLLIDPVNQQATEYLKTIKGGINEIKVDKYLKLVKKYLEEDKIIESKELIDKVLALYPEHPEAKEFHKRIEMVYQQQKAARLESMFKQGLEFYENKSYSDAIDLWEKILVVNPGHVRAGEYIAIAGKKIEEIEEAARKQALEASRKKTEALVKNGLQFYKQSKWDEARKLFEEAKEMTPDNGEIRQYLIDTNNKLAEAYYNKGLTLYKGKKNLPEAINLFEKAAALSPGNVEIADQLNKASVELKDINKAKADEYNRQGLKEYGLGNLKEAVEAWEKALALDPENDKIKNNLSRAKEELEKK